MNYIELLGPQGVGKTTLLNQLAERRTEEYEWKTYEEAIKEVAQSLSFNEMKTIYGKVLYLLNKLNPVDFKRMGLASRIIKDAIPEHSENAKSQYDNLFELHLSYMANNDLGVSSLKKIQLLNWHVKTLSRYFIFDTIQYQSTIVLDEGLLKNIYGFSEFHESKFNTCAMPDAVINCYLSYEENIRRIRERQDKTGRLSIMHRGTKDKYTLEDRVEMIAKLNNKKVEVIKNANIPVLDVNMDDILQSDKIKYVDSFIKKYSIK